MFSVAIELGAPNGLKHYRPLPVLAQLRGYAGEDSQVRADISKGKAVSITGLATLHCPTGRDLFFEKRQGLDTPSWERSVLGKIVDSLLAELHDAGMTHMEDVFESSIQTGKPVDIDSLERLIVASGEKIIREKIEGWEYPGTEPRFKEATLESFAEHIAPNDGDGLVDRTMEALRDLVKYETRILMEYLRQRRRAGLFAAIFLREPGRWMAEARATLARLQSEVRIDKHADDARIFGLSENIKPDFLYAVTLIGDIKTGKYHSFYESVATGYAIFAEHHFRKRINTAVILAVDLDVKAGKLRSHRVVIVRPTNDQRQLWVTRRDMALKIIRAEAAPPHPPSAETCTACSYRPHCWEGGTPGGVPITPVEPPKKGKPGPKSTGGPSQNPVI